MITVTPSACAQLSELLEEGAISAHLSLRVVVNGNSNLEIMLESPQAEDEQFSYRGRVVLAVEPEAATRLDGQRLDFDNSTSSHS